MQCRGCKLYKPHEEFPLRSKERGVRYTLCRPCTAIYQHSWYVENRDELISRARLRRAIATAENRSRAWQYLREHPCVDCGEADPVVLEFDHVRDKTANVSYMIFNGWSWATIEHEIAKCEVRCVNCHLRKTARETGIFERKSGFRIGEEEVVYGATY